MSVTIMEALQNAQINLVGSDHPLQNAVGKSQLNNAVILLEKGYKLSDEVEPLLEAAGGSVNDVPDLP